jgi:hypothetical protein
MRSSVVNFPTQQSLAIGFLPTIIETGFKGSYSALIVMVGLRNALKLHEEILIVDGRGAYW